MKKKLLLRHEQLSKEIQYLIQHEGYREGQKLPSERELASLFSVQRMSIRRALETLVQENILYVRHHRGYFVAPPRVIIHTALFDDALMKDAQGVITKRLKLHCIPATNRLANKMYIAKESPIIHLTKLQYIHKKPTALCNFFIPDDVPSSHMQKKDIKEMEARLKAISHQEITHINHKIKLVYANETECKYLKVPKESPLMKNSGLIYDKSDQLLLYFENILLLDHYIFLRLENAHEEQKNECR